MIQFDEIHHKIILVSSNEPYLIIKDLVLKENEMVVVWGGGGGGGVSKTDQNAALSSNNGKTAKRCRLLVCTTITL